MIVNPWAHYMLEEEENKKKKEEQENERKSFLEYEEREHQKYLKKQDYMKKFAMAVVIHFDNEEIEMLRDMLDWYLWDF